MSPSPPTGIPEPAAADSEPAQLRAAWLGLQPALGARSAGVALQPLPVGRDRRPADAEVRRLGPWQCGPAWSTSKVPVAVAALAVAEPSEREQMRALARAAITESDNAAAVALWDRLGAGANAAARVDAVLAAHGDPVTLTQAHPVRPPYTPFGQTAWSLTQQVCFVAGLVRSDTQAAREIVRLMRQVIPAQRWGLGRLDDATFKGGWGPEEGGSYLVRQLGVVTLRGRRVAVAVAALADSFDHGVDVLDELAGWLATQPSLS